MLAMSQCGPVCLQEAQLAEMVELRAEIDDSCFVAVNCTFDSNNAMSLGGVIQSNDGQTTIKDSLFTSNYDIYLEMSFTLIMVSSTAYLAKMQPLFRGKLLTLTSLQPLAITNSKFHNNMVISAWWRSA